MNEMSINNMKCTWPTRKFCVGDSVQPIFHWLELGICIWGNANFMFTLGVTQILAFLDINMLVLPMLITALGEPLNAKICVYYHVYPNTKSVYLHNMLLLSM